MGYSMKDYFNIFDKTGKFYGLHLSATFEGLDDCIRSETQVSRFLSGLADDIGMIRYGDPIVARFGEGHEIDISGFQLITTSAISIHTNDKHKDLYLDVFSCKTYDVEKVFDFVRASFGVADRMNHTVVLRR